MVKIEFDGDDFARRLTLAAEAAANEGIDRLASELENLFESVRRSHGGQTVDEVMPALRSACLNNDFHPTDEQLHYYASAISENKRIAVQTEHVRL